MRKSVKQFISFVALIAMLISFVPAFDLPASATTAQGTTQDPCANGHTYEEGWCTNCAKPDPNYNRCEDKGHEYENGYCIWCLSFESTTKATTKATTKPTTVSTTKATVPSVSTAANPILVLKSTTAVNPILDHVLSAELFSTGGPFTVTFDWRAVGIRDNDASDPGAAHAVVCIYGTVFGSSTTEQSNPGLSITGTTDWQTESFQFQNVGTYSVSGTDYPGNILRFALWKAKGELLVRNVVINDANGNVRYSLSTDPIVQQVVSNMVDDGLTECSLDELAAVDFANCPWVAGQYSTGSYYASLRYEDAGSDTTKPTVPSEPPIEVDYKYTVSNGEVTIIEYLGDDCIVDIPASIDGLPVTTIGDFVFYNCNYLTSVTIPNSVTTIGVSAFDGTAITTITIPASVNFIDMQAFAYCTNLQEVKFEKNCSLTKIGYSVFRGCVSLTTIVIPEGVSSIGDYAFEECTSLYAVTLPKSVTELGAYIFEDCSNLRDIYYAGTYFDCRSIDVWGRKDDYFDNAIWHYIMCQEDQHKFTVNSGFTCEACGYSKTPGNPVIEDKFYDRIVLVETEGFEYSCDGVNWQTYCWFYDISLDTTYTFYQRVKGSDVAQRSEMSPGTTVIVESIIESVVFKDVELIECSDGNYSDGDFYYNLPEIEAVVTFKDGTVKTIRNELTIDNASYSIGNNAMSLQYKTPWTIGTYEVTATLLNLSNTLTVTILPTPVEYIEIKDMVLYQGLDTDQWDDAEKYNVSPVLSKVVFKDGTIGQIASDYLIYKGIHYVDTNAWELQTETPWIPGNTYTVTGTLMGASATFNVTILENPVQALEVIEFPDKTIYFEGEMVNLKGAIIRIRYSDGSFEDVLFPDDYTYAYSREYYSEKLNRVDTLSVYSNTSEGDQHEVGIALFGLKCFIPVTVKSRNDVEGVSIRENKDKSLTITAYYSDGTSMDMKLLDICSGGWGDIDGYGAYILTDKGQFSAWIHFEENSFAIGLYTKSWDMVLSNSLPMSQWMKVVNTIGAYDLIELSTFIKQGFFAKPLHYSGEITAENIDSIICIAGQLDGLFYKSGSNGADVKKAVKKYFGHDDIDISMSKYYNPATDRYVAYITDGGYGGEQLYCPPQISYQNGIWTVVMTVNSSITPGGKDVFRFELNDDRQIIGVQIDDGTNVEYSVVFKDWNGTILSTQTYHYGDTVIAPADPTKAADSTYTYTFDGWDKEVVVCDGNATYTAVYERRTILRITGQPKNVSVANGATAKITVGATGDGLKYQWYIKNAGSSKFSKSSITSATYSVTMSDKADGRQVYCIITDRYGNSVRTVTVKMVMKTALKITKQPVDVCVKNGETATVKFTATGDGLTYKWYYKDAGASSYKLTTTFKSNTYTTTMTDARAGRRVLCKVYDKYGNMVKTNSVLLTQPVRITKQPANVCVEYGETVTVKVVAKGEGLTYKWYFKDAAASSYKLTTSFTGNTYTTTMNDARAGRRVLCKIYDKYGNSVQSKSVLLSQAVRITKQPASVTVAKGATAKVTVTAKGDGLIYEWYYKNPGGKFTYTPSFKGNTYSVKMDSSRHGRQVFCVITDKYGNFVESKTVTLRMK